MKQKEYTKFKKTKNQENNKSRVREEVIKKIEKCFEKQDVAGLKKIYNNNPNIVFARKCYAKSLLNMGDSNSMKTIIKIYNSISILEMSNHEKLCLAKAYAHFGFYEEANDLVGKDFSRSEYAETLIQVKSKRNMEAIINLYSNRPSDMSNLEKSFLTVAYIYLGRLDESLKIINTMEETLMIKYKAIIEEELGNYQKSIDYCLKLIEMGKQLDSIIDQLLYLYLHENRYDEALLFILNNPKYKNYITRYDDLMLFLCKKTNVFTTTHNLLDNSTYFRKQIIEYNKNRALEHIKRHLNSENVSGLGFFKTKDVNELQAIYDTATNLCKEEYFAESAICDTYQVPWEDIGLNGENYLEIIAFRGTNEIVTMYPVFESRIENQKVYKNKCR